LLSPACTAVSVADLAAFIATRFPAILTTLLGVALNVTSNSELAVGSVIVKGVVLMG